ncbi:MAG: bifunctional N-acetylglucosamine-1-phosphate uridyltransferase/glucosamine-1-phosphate acetyltransferase [Elusimicrobia bacterium]|nr:bifunctional N-acetylglucosamine-1-phosphate uridyltransferase/glucosamine-1-phosphate acetyltransferase [Elusimicrobiota bacterium]
MNVPDIVVLAGGAGSRMRVDHPKALHPVFFRPMIRHVLDAAAALPHRAFCLVVGRGERELREQCRAYPDLRIVRQEAPQGAADALREVQSALGGPDADVLVLEGDRALLSARSLAELLSAHAASGAACTLGLPAGPEREPAAYCFRSRDLFNALKLDPSGADGAEPTLGDAAAALAAQGGAISEYRFADPDETLDINDHEGLWRVEAVMRARLNRELMLKGVSIQDPGATLIDPRCRIEPDVRIEAGCTLINSTIGAGAVLENSCRVIDSEVGQGSTIRQGTCLEKSRVGRDCRLGPYARLRAGSHLDDAVWVGSFVEIENAALGSGTRAAHLSFIADALIGRNVEIGCGFIACNSSGRPLKQRTVIEDNVFIGSASQAIAPVTLGAGSFIATGTSVTEDVPPDSFVISRGRQVTKPGYAKKYGRAKGAPAA